MNLRTTNPPLTPPRRGTGHAVRLPSWEGLGVGSRSQCMRTDERGLSMNRGAGGTPAPLETRLIEIWPFAVAPS